MKNKQLSENCSGSVRISVWFLKKNLDHKPRNKRKQYFPMYVTDRK